MSSANNTYKTIYDTQETNNDNNNNNNVYLKAALMIPEMKIPVSPGYLAATSMT